MRYTHQYLSGTLYTRTNYSNTNSKPYTPYKPHKLQTLNPNPRPQPCLMFPIEDLVAQWYPFYFCWLWVPL